MTREDTMQHHEPAGARRASGAEAMDTPNEKQLPDAVLTDVRSETSRSSAETPSEPYRRQKWHQWFSPDDTPEERRLITKLDLLIIVFAFLAYWTKVLDASAVTAAYVSGMKEDLGLFGNELNYLNLVFMAGFISMQIPLTMAMTRLPANYVLPAADLLWGVFTLAQFRVTAVQQLYVLRFFVGALGGFFFPAVQWYLGCWYKRSELSRRGALFYVASQVGNMSAGFVQAGAHANLAGRAGLAGWRWLYIVCFACTVPVAVLGFFALPGTPDRPSGGVRRGGLRLLSERELAVARRRLADDHLRPAGALTWPVVRDVLRGWHFWVLVTFAMFFTMADGISSTSAMTLWLKSEGYGVVRTNTIATASPAVTIVTALVMGVLSDAYDCKAALIASVVLLNLFADIVLAVWEIPVGLKFFAFLAAGSANGIMSVVFAWANEICASSSEERALVMSSMNTVGNAVGAGLAVVVWPTVDAPRYPVGYPATAGVNVCMLIMVVVLRWYWVREQAAKKKDQLKA